MLRAGALVFLFSFFSAAAFAQSCGQALPGGKYLYRLALNDSGAVTGACMTGSGPGTAPTGSALEIRDRQGCPVQTIAWMPASPVYCDYIFITSTFTDASGNIYASGRFRGRADLDPGEGEQYFQPADPSAADGFLIKLNQEGNFCWARSFGGQASPYAFCDLYCGSTTADGHLLFLGSYAWGVDFDPGEGSRVEFTGSADPRPFILRLDTAGRFIDVHSIACTGIAGISSYFTDPEDNLYITFYFHRSIDVDPDPQHSLQFFSVNEYYNTCSVKYDSQLRLIWARHLDLPAEKPVITGNDLPAQPVTQVSPASLHTTTST